MMKIYYNLVESQILAHRGTREYFEERIAYLYETKHYLTEEEGTKLLEILEQEYPTIPVGE